MTTPEEAQNPKIERAEPLELEMGGDIISTQFEKPAVTLETRPVGDPKERKFEMLVHIGPEERILELGMIDFEEARKVHREAVEFVRGRLSGIEMVAQATAEALANQIRAKLRQGEGME